MKVSINVDKEMLDSALRYLERSDAQEIVEEALRQFVAREAGRRLAALGGTMPDLEAPPRRRFGKK